MSEFGMEPSCKCMRYEIEGDLACLECMEQAEQDERDAEEEYLYGDCGY